MVGLFGIPTVAVIVRTSVKSSNERAISGMLQPTCDPHGHVLVPMLTGTYFHFFGHAVHPHLVMELLGYTAGSQLYFFLRRRWQTGQRAALPLEANLWVIVGGVFGALAGSKGLALIESLPEYHAQWAATHDPAAWFGGKTIVGGLLGAWAGVEIAKKASALPTRPATCSSSRSSPACAWAGWAAS